MILSVPVSVQANSTAATAIVAEDGDRHYEAFHWKLTPKAFA